MSFTLRQIRINGNLNPLGIQFPLILICLRVNDTFLYKKLVFLVCNNLHLIPPGYFHWKILWKSTKPKKIRKIYKSLNPFFKKECHLLSDKFCCVNFESVKFWESLSPCIHIFECQSLNKKIVYENNFKVCYQFLSVESVVTTTDLTDSGGWAPIPPPRVRLCLFSLPSSPLLLAGVNYSHLGFP